jgi:hypothetical protein
VTRRQLFFFTVEMSAEFRKHEPVHADRWLEANREQIAKVEFMKGPRGGNYRLVTPPDAWQSYVSVRSLTRNSTEFITRRWGRYVRPDRVPPEHTAYMFGTFTMPVRRGKAMLPTGEVVHTEGKAIAVPVAPPVVG